MWPSRSRTFQKIFPFILLGMILMRLIWMQLRTYPVEYESRAVASLAAATSEFPSICPQGPAGIDHRADLFNFGLSYSDVNLIAPGYTAAGLLLCKLEQIDSKAFVRMNQLLFCASILAAVMLTRFMTSSWMLSLVVAAMLFSRGMLLADIGSVSTSYIIMFLFMAGFASFAHFFRSGSKTMALSGTIAFSLLTLVDRSLWFVCLVPLNLLFFAWLLTRNLPGFRLLKSQATKQVARQRPVSTSDLKSLRQDYQGDFSSQFARLAGTFRWFFGIEFGARDQPAEREDRLEKKASSLIPGGLFRIMNLDFYNWIYDRARGLKLAIALFFGCFFGLAADFLLSRYLSGTYATGYFTHLFPVSDLLDTIRLNSLGFLWTQLVRVDMHLIVSFFITALCTVQHPRAGLAGFFELSTMALFLCIGVAVVCTFTDAAEYRWATDHYRILGQKPIEAVYGIRAWMQWLEPLILTMGVVGFYNLMKVLDTRISGKTN